MKPGTRYHMCVDIRGALTRISNSRRRFTEFTDDTGAPVTREVAMAELMDELARGRRVLPMGECDDFDYETGCRGHRAADVSAPAAAGPAGTAS